MASNICVCIIKEAITDCKVKLLYKNVMTYPPPTLSDGTVKEHKTLVLQIPNKFIINWL